MQSHNNNNIDEIFVHSAIDSETDSMALTMFKKYRPSSLWIGFAITLVMIFLWQYRTEHFPKEGFILYHGKNEIVFQDITLFYHYFGGNLELFHAPTEKGTDKVVTFQIWTGGQLQRTDGKEFVPIEYVDYDLIAHTAFFPEDQSGIPDLYTMMSYHTWFLLLLAGFIFTFIPQLGVVLLKPFGWLPSRRIGFVPIKYDKDSNYSVWGIGLFAASLILYLFTHGFLGI